MLTILSPKFLNVGEFLRKEAMPDQANVKSLFCVKFKHVWKP